MSIMTYYSDHSHKHGQDSRALLTSLNRKFPRSGATNSFCVTQHGGHDTSAHLDDDVILISAAALRHAAAGRAAVGPPRGGVRQVSGQAVQELLCALKQTGDVKYPVLKLAHGLHESMQGNLM